MGDHKDRPYGFCECWLPARAPVDGSLFLFWLYLCRLQCRCLAQVGGAVDRHVVVEHLYPQQATAKILDHVFVAWVFEYWRKEGAWVLGPVLAYVLEAALLIGAHRPPIEGGDVQPHLSEA